VQHHPNKQLEETHFDMLKNKRALKLLYNLIIGNKNARHKILYTKFEKVKYSTNIVIYHPNNGDSKLL
jgi:hypothetical protein